MPDDCEKTLLFDGRSIGWAFARVNGTIVDEDNAPKFLPEELIPRLEPPMRHFNAEQSPRRHFPHVIPTWFLLLIAIKYPPGHLRLT
jgi:hypothetical protein